MGAEISTHGKFDWIDRNIPVYSKKTFEGERFEKDSATASEKRCAKCYATAHSSTTFRTPITDTKGCQSQHAETRKE